MHCLPPRRFGTPKQGKWNPLVVFGGYASVGNNVVTILCIDCERAADVPEAAQLRPAGAVSTRAAIFPPARVRLVPRRAQTSSP